MALIRAERTREGLARLDRAGEDAATTSDRIAPAIVALARAVAAAATGGGDAIERRLEADAALAALGLAATGWETAFSLAVGARPPQPVGPRA